MDRFKKCSTALLGLFVLLFLLQVTNLYAAQVNEEWVSGTSWSTGTWYPIILPSPYYPNNGVGGYDYNVFFNHSTDDVLLNVNVTIDNLLITHGARLEIQESKVLTLASGEDKGVITNNGTLFLDAVGTDTKLNSSNAVLTGSGTLSMSNSTRNLVLVDINNATLTNGTNHTIQGSGSIGNSSRNTTLFNNGTVKANQSTPLILTDNVDNSGTLEADGGTLKISAATVNNSGGTIRGNGISSVEMSSAGSIYTNVTGGILEGNTKNSSGIVTLTDLENKGTLTLDNSTTTEIIGTIVNSGSIEMAAGGTDTKLNSSNAVLTGSGTLSMSNSTRNLVLVDINNATLTNGTNHTIQGSGSIGNSSRNTTLFNNGTVKANQSTPLILTDNVDNSGTLEADGGTLNLSNAKVTNSGTIIGSGSSSVNMSAGTTVTGGVLEGNTKNSSGTVNLGTLENRGTLTLDNSTTTNINGTITNNSIMVLNAGGTDTRLNSNNAILSGSGTLSMSNSTRNLVLSMGNNSTLTNDTNHTIQGSGSIGSYAYGTTFTNKGLVNANQSTALNLIGTVNNQGTLKANSGSTLAVNATLNNLSGTTLTDGTYVAAGTLRLPGSVNTNAASIILDGTSSQMYNGPSGTTNALANFAVNTASGSFSLFNSRDFTTAGDFTNNGDMSFDTESDFMAGSNGTSVYYQTNGTTIVNGTLKASAVSVSGGVISGNGTIDSNVSGAGTLSPGISPGSLTITGNYNQGSDGRLFIELGGTQQGITYDYLDILGEVYFGGSLEVVLWESFIPKNGDSFSIVKFKSINQQFDSSKIFLPKGWIWDVIYTDNNLTLTANAVPIPGAIWLLGSGLLLLSGIRRKREN